MVEDSSFWFRHRNNCIASVVHRFPPKNPFLDIGGGNGYVTERLIKEGFEVVLLEPGPQGAFNAKKHRKVPHVICAAFQDTDILPESIAAAGLFDVIEHIEEDHTIIQDIHGILKTDGLLYITAPAHNTLWSLSDEQAFHFRRYNRSMIEELLQEGFNILFSSYLFRPLILPLWLFRTVPYKMHLTRDVNIFSKEKEHGIKKDLMTSLLSGSLEREYNKLKKGNSIPRGTSCIVVAKKK